jgi:alanine racemase
MTSYCTRQAPIDGRHLKVPPIYKKYPYFYRMKYSTDELSSLLEAQYTGRGKRSFITELLTDSRSLHDPDKALFFAIPGLHHNGHDFIYPLYQSGVRHFVISQDISLSNFPEAHFYQVINVVKALQKIASHHRQQFDIPIIAITGSNGKTIIKEWLFQLLHPFYSICRSPKSYNSQIGVPLSVWQLEPQHQLGLFEAGISKPDEMEHLASILNPSIGLFSNIGAAHSEGFTSEENKISEKLRLFTTVKRLIYCKDHQAIHQQIVRKGIPTFSWGMDVHNDLQILDIQKKVASSRIVALYNSDQIEIYIPFSDDASIENAIHCWAMMLVLGIAQVVIQERMLQLEPIAMRMEVREGINDCIIINDSYNADLTGLRASMVFCQERYPQHKKTLILSDILQSGLTSEALHQSISQLIQLTRFDRLIGIGKKIADVAALLPAAIRFEHYPDTSIFLKQQQHYSFKSEVILIKGARSFAFERISTRLSKKVHQTQLEVNIHSLIENIRVYQQQLQPNTKIMVMVKAAAYGSGSIEVARALSFHKVDYLAVAYADEGIELRKHGIKLPIMVLNPEEAVFDSMVIHHLEPEIYTLNLLKSFGEFTQSIDEPIHIHLKLDTGMHRLGFSQEDLSAIADLLHAYPQLIVRSIFSHLAASESVEEDDFTYQQFQQFETMYNWLSQELDYLPIRHILNSNGILRFPSYQMEMVRLGLGVYGIDGTGIIQSKLNNVLTLSCRISQIKQLSAGASIGYGRKGKATANMTIATLSIGYADGIARLAGNGNFKFLIRGKAAPTIGQVCMDMCMVDITHIPEAEEGDIAIVFGEDWPVAQLAEASQTIPYEIFAGISGRVHRAYVQE